MNPVLNYESINYSQFKSKHNSFCFCLVDQSARNLSIRKFSKGLLCQQKHQKLEGRDAIFLQNVSTSLKFVSAISWKLLD